MSNRKLYCMRCRKFVPQRALDEHGCPFKYISAVDKEMTGIVDRLYKMGIPPVYAVWSATSLKGEKGKYAISIRIDIGRRISEDILGKLPQGWGYIWETATSDRSPMHLIAYGENWCDSGSETLEERIKKLIKDLEEFLDTKDCEAIKAVLILMEGWG